MKIVTRIRKVADKPVCKFANISKEDGRLLPNDSKALAPDGSRKLPLACHLSQAKRLELVLFNYLLKQESNGRGTIENVIVDVRRDKPERILDMAIKLLPKEVVDNTVKTVAPIIINQQFVVGEDKTIAPSTDTVDGAIVG